MGWGGLFFKGGGGRIGWRGGRKPMVPSTKFIVCGNVANILINVADI